jgi:hypothetical protein
MDIERLIPLAGLTLIVLILAAPAIRGIYSNIKEGRRLRKIRKATPGPLLGVVFPNDEHKRTKKK